MNYNNIKEALQALSAISNHVENLYVESGGEITAHVEDLEAQKKALSDMLEGEGIDSLGRWLKAKEDEKAMYKAEKAEVESRIKSVDRTIDFIKKTVGDILRATGREKAKGSFYTFKAYNSTSLKLNIERIDRDWLDKVTKAARAVGLPEYLEVAVDASVSSLAEWASAHDDEGSEYFYTEVTPSVSFLKPKKAKEA